MSCGVDQRCGSDHALLWLWCRLAAVAPIRPLVWEPPDAAGVALQKKKKKFAQTGSRHVLKELVRSLNTEEKISREI